MRHTVVASLGSDVRDSSTSLFVDYVRLGIGAEVPPEPQSWQALQKLRVANRPVADVGNLGRVVEAHHQITKDGTMQFLEKMKRLAKAYQSL